MKRSITALILPICWLIICTFLLTIPGKAFPKENWLDRLWVDKWVHIFLFAIMVWLWCRAVHKLGRRDSQPEKTFLFLAILWLAYGIGMEFVQRDLVANRGFDVWDIMADGVGVAVGLIYSRSRYIKK